jgi:hypothetical protein
VTGRRCDEAVDLHVAGCDDRDVASDHVAELRPFAAASLARVEHEKAVVGDASDDVRDLVHVRVQEQCRAAPADVPDQVPDGIALE